MIITETPTPLVNSATTVRASFSIQDKRNRDNAIDGEIMVDLQAHKITIGFFGPPTVETLLSLIDRTVHQEMLTRYEESQLAELVARYGMGFAGARTVGTGWQSNGAAMLALALAAEKLSTSAARFVIGSVSLDREIADDQLPISSST
jgi:hypothetical protein